MKKDITSREDILLLVNEFYNKVEKDEQIGFIFTDIMKVSWEKHLPVMYDFFENMLFYTGSYTGNPMEIHRKIQQRFPLIPHISANGIIYLVQPLMHYLRGKS